MENANTPRNLPEGLSTEEVARRRAAGQINVSRERAGKSYVRIVTDNLCTFFNLVWAIVAVLMALCNSFSNMTFLAVIIPNVLIAIVQECRAKHTVERLSVTTDPRAKAVRDGILCDISSEQIVLGDVLLLEMGQQVLSDGIVLDGLAEVNESMLTGESDAIRKQQGDHVLAGSYLVSGSIWVQVCAVGKDNYVHKIEKAAKSFRAPASNLFADLNRLLRVIACFMVPVAVAMFFLTLFGGQYAATASALVEATKSTCGAVIGMIPAGMYLLVTVTLTLSVLSLGQKRTLVRDMYSIEMLASADVLCLDKTGTITDGTMCVCDVIALGCYTEEQIARVMALVEGSERSINATSHALIDRFGTAQDDEITDKVPFSSERKYSAVTFAGAGTFSLGAPHFVHCPVCEETEQSIRRFAAEGKRVLLLAAHAAPDAPGEPLALITLADRIRPAACETIARFQSQDVTVKIISGDHAATVSAIAGRVGVNHYEKYISCEALSDEQLEAAAEEYAVFGRVTPEQKVLLVKKLKSLGHTVAMTGDGVNDTLALKESNCAIAMAAGSDVACKVAQIVLLDSDFATLPDVVREGRRCINNVRRSASLFLMKTILAVALSMVTVVTGLLALIPGLGLSVFEYPFQPKGLVLLEMFVIGLASVLLALEPNNERIRGSFIRTVLTNSLPNGLALLFPVIGVLILGGAGLFTSIEQRNTFAMIAVLAAGFTNLVALSYPWTKWRLFVISVMALALGAAIPLSIFLVGDMFEFHYAAGAGRAVFWVVIASTSFSIAVHLAHFLWAQARAKRKEKANYA